MVISLVLAGGSGQRMGADIPKQFIKLCGKPIIIRSISAFVNNPLVDMCLVSVGKDNLEYTQELIKQYFPEKNNIIVIEGGTSRGDTLLKALNFLQNNDKLKNSILLTHDAVRPFINDRIIEENIEYAKKYGACNTCISSVDTVFISENGEYIDYVPNRSTVFNAQTPQSFQGEKLYSLIQKTPKQDYEGLTDACSVFVYHGEKVYLVRGETYNIKITYPEDISKAELIIKEYYN